MRLQERLSPPSDRQEGDGSSWRSRLATFDIPAGHVLRCLGTRRITISSIGFALCRLPKTFHALSLAAVVGNCGLCPLE